MKARIINNTTTLALLITVLALTPSVSPVPRRMLSLDQTKDAMNNCYSKAGWYSSQANNLIYSTDWDKINDLMTQLKQLYGSSCDSAFIVNWNGSCKMDVRVFNQEVCKMHYESGSDWGTRVVQPVMAHIKSALDSVYQNCNPYNIS